MSAARSSARQSFACRRLKSRFEGVPPTVGPSQAQGRLGRGFVGVEPALSLRRVDDQPNGSTGANSTGALHRMCSPGPDTQNFDAHSARSMPL
jgi:hypothetical protein